MYGVKCRMTHVEPQKLINAKVVSLDKIDRLSSFYEHLKHEISLLEDKKEKGDIASDIFNLEKTQLKSQETILKNKLLTSSKYLKSKKNKSYKKTYTVVDPQNIQTDIYTQSFDYTTGSYDLYPIHPDHGFYSGERVKQEFDSPHLQKYSHSGQKDTASKARSSLFGGIFNAKGASGKNLKGKPLAFSLGGAAVAAAGVYALSNTAAAARIGNTIRYAVRSDKGKNAIKDSVTSNEASSSDITRQDSEISDDTVVHVSDKVRAEDIVAARQNASATDTASDSSTSSSSQSSAEDVAENVASGGNVDSANASASENAGDSAAEEAATETEGEGPQAGEGTSSPSDDKSEEKDNSSENENSQSSDPSGPKSDPSSGGGSDGGGSGGGGSPADSILGGIIGGGLQDQISGEDGGDGEGGDDGNSGNDGSSGNDGQDAEAPNPLFQVLATAAGAAAPALVGLAGNILSGGFNLLKSAGSGIVSLFSSSDDEESSESQTVSAEADDALLNEVATLETENQKLQKEKAKKQEEFGLLASQKEELAKKRQNLEKKMLETQQSNASRSQKLVTFQQLQRQNRDLRDEEKKLADQEKKIQGEVDAKQKKIDENNKKIADNQKRLGFPVSFLAPTTAEEKVEQKAEEDGELSTVAEDSQNKKQQSSSNDGVLQTEADRQSQQQTSNQEGKTDTQNTNAQNTSQATQEDQSVANDNKSTDKVVKNNSVLDQPCQGCDQPDQKA